jgi:hypothetical protein
VRGSLFWALPRATLALRPRYRSARRSRAEGAVHRTPPFRRLQIEIHVELVRVRPEPKSVVFFHFQLNPVADEILREDVTFEQEIVIRFDGGNRAS